MVSPEALTKTALCFISVDEKQTHTNAVGQNVTRILYPFATEKTPDSRRFFGWSPSDTGLLLLREIDRRCRLTQDIAKACLAIPDRQVNQNTSSSIWFGSTRFMALPVVIETSMTTTICALISRFKPRSVASRPGQQSDSGQNGTGGWPASGCRRASSSVAAVHLMRMSKRQADRVGLRRHGYWAAW